jgi:uncharacterized protein (TIGR02246 family)
MKVSDSLLLSALLMSSIGLSGAESTNAEANAVEDLVKQYSRACQQEDLTTVSDLFAKRPDTVMIPAIGSHVSTGWESITKGYASFFRNVEDCQMQCTVHSIQIFSNGQSACLTASQDATMRLNDRLVELKDVRMVWVLEKTDGQWKILNAHWSISAQP